MACPVRTRCPAPAPSPPTSLRRAYKRGGWERVRRLYRGDDVAKERVLGEGKGVGANVRMRASNPGPRRDARCDWILTLKYAHESSHAERGRHRQRKARRLRVGRGVEAIS
jgi:hypothetical protein